MRGHPAIPARRMRRFPPFDRIIDGVERMTDRARRLVLQEVTTSMWNHRWLLALPLALAVSIGSAQAASIRDHAGLFDQDVVREAEAKLNQIEREAGITTTIETIESLGGQSLDRATIEHA